MKKTLILLNTLAISCVSAMGMRNAKSPNQPTETPSEIKSYFLVGGNYAHVHIKPHDNPSLHGHLEGAQGIYEFRPANRIYEGAKLMWRQGKVHGSAGKRDLFDFDTQVRIGYTGSVDKFLLTAFSGFGWRYLGHTLRQHGQSNLRFYYNEVYIPVGLLADYKPNTSFSCGLYATWMPQVFPNVNIIPNGNARWVLKYRLANFLVEIPLTYNFIRKKTVWSVNFKPFFEYWQDGRSLAKTSTNISLDFPGNTYKFWGGELNIGCSF